MNENDIKKLKRLISKGEGTSTEFKESSKNIPKSLYNTICSFLNTKGGHIFLGVNDKKDIIGIDENNIQKLKTDLETTLRSGGKIFPESVVEIETLKIDGKNIIYFYVPEESVVYTNNNKIYVRSEDADFDITKKELKSLNYLIRNLKIISNPKSLANFNKVTLMRN